jgi:phage terminase Nu1 subunit (DNA packaging protein)
MSDTNLVEPKVLAKIFGFEGVRRIDQLVQDGVIEPTLTTVNGRKVRRYDLIPVTMMYIRHLQNKIRDKEPDSQETSDDRRKLKAEADLKEAKAAIEQMKKAEFEARMHRSEDVEKVITDLAAAARSEFLALPGLLAVDVAASRSAAEAAGIIKAAVNTALNRLAEYGYKKEDFRKLVIERENWMNEKKDADEEDTEE